MKIIFLDIDGVILPFSGSKHNSALGPNKWGVEGFCQKAVKILNEVLLETDADIVISSDWRHQHPLFEMREIFEANGIIKLPIAYTIRSKTYTAMNLEGGRVDEINEYVDRHRLRHWVSIDDLDMFDLFPNFVHCKHPNQGIKEIGLKEKIIKILNK